MRDRVEQLVSVISSVVLGKEDIVKLAVACMLARGHLLIEDLPGMGKTTLAQTLAHVFGLDYQRVQFTSDMLPADILGGAIFDQQTSSFVYHPGPVFTQLLLADEINRSTPKTQSALLEAMEEGQVSSEGVTRQLPAPFFVIATQNPVSQFGTFPLPESQLDRFLMRISLGYPDPETEKELLKHGDTRCDIEQLSVCVDSSLLLKLQDACSQVAVSDPVLNYVQRLAQFSRDSDDVVLGLSPRGALALIEAAKAWAYMSGRDYLMPDDVQKVFGAVVEHRLLLRNESESGSARGILSQVDVLG
ncbi:AAA family ATPase [Neptunomonas japonica]|uniref:MoxR-like ATPase n=1 Tax=Neptunomonas japonica JAMM 1380 TaxID=1441457 RepID=A0A7R6SV58_9GAMM|nr:MoxR family ATPase [Neptunomonas japonica]BBB29056.1 MoxR-like ATPase [Neptunomonas japonica JAMM 1380]